MEPPMRLLTACLSLLVALPATAQTPTDPAPDELAALSDDLPLQGDQADPDHPQVDEERPLAPLVSAALLEPDALAAVEPLLLASDRSAISRLADQLVPPADVMCRRIRDRLEGAA